MNNYAHIALALAIMPVVSMAQTLETSIVTDWETVQYYGGVEETQKKIDATIAYANSILESDVNVSILVTHVEIPTSEVEDLLPGHTHVDFLLEALIKHRNDISGHYYADTTVMLTKRNLMRGTQNLAGFARIGSVCSASSTSITELYDNGLDGETLAHELGHVLGSYHDGEPPCQDTPSYGYLMAPTVHSGNSFFSQCSIDTIQLHLSLFGDCLSVENTGPAPIRPTPTAERGGGGAISILMILILIAVVSAQSTRTELNARR